MPMTMRAETLEEFAGIAVEFARGLRPRAAHEEPRATLITLSGELGAGKTAFVKAAAKALGVREVVNSPTFVLEKIYALPREIDGHQVSINFARLVHIDAYRLEKGVELAALGFDELLRDRGNLIFLEWPEKVADALPPPTAAIRIEQQRKGTRKLSFSVQ